MVLEYSVPVRTSTRVLKFWSKVMLLVRTRRIYLHRRCMYLCSVMFSLRNFQVHACMYSLVPVHCMYVMYDVMYVMYVRTHVCMYAVYYVRSTYVRTSRRYVRTGTVLPTTQRIYSKSSTTVHDRHARSQTTDIITDHHHHHHEGCS